MAFCLTKIASQIFLPVPVQTVQTAQYEVRSSAYPLHCRPGPGVCKPFEFKELVPSQKENSYLGKEASI